jgi:hypothetical protein
MSSIREGKIQKKEKKKKPSQKIIAYKSGPMQKNPNKWITLTYAHQKMDDTKQLSQKKVMAKKRELIKHKKTK